jgi:alpha-glucosidase
MLGPIQRNIGNCTTTDPTCIAVREELKKVMKFWLDLGADGFRVDLAASLIRNDPDHEAIRAVTEPGSIKTIPKRCYFPKWGAPAVAIPASFHIDSLLQFGEAAYGILLGSKSRLDGDARKPHAFFERAGGGDIKAFVE